MKTVFLYEWANVRLSQIDRNSAIYREGQAMLNAVRDDFSRIDGLNVITADHLAMDVDREIAIIDLNQQLTDGKTLNELLASTESSCCSRTSL